MHSCAHIAQTFLFMVLIPRKECVCVYRYTYMHVRFILLQSHCIEFPQHCRLNMLRGAKFKGHLFISKLFFVSFAVFRLGEGLADALELEHQDQVEMLPLVNMASMQTAQSEILGLLQKLKVSSHVYKKLNPSTLLSRLLLSL